MSSKAFFEIFNPDFKTAQFRQPNDATAVAVAAVALAGLVDLHKTPVVWSDHDALAATLLLLEEFNHKRGKIGFSAEVTFGFMEHAGLFIPQITEVTKEYPLGEFFEDRDFIVIEAAAQRTCAKRKYQILKYELRR